MTKEVIDFVELVYPKAKKLSSFNADFITAQGGLESGWGKKRVGNFNLFGMKCPKNWTGKKVLITTTEIHSNMNVKYPEIISIKQIKENQYKYTVKDWFCDFDSIEECLTHHFKLLNKPQFAHALPYKDDPYKYVAALQSGDLKYATSLDYVNLMYKIILMVKRAKTILKLQ